MHVLTIIRSWVKWNLKAEVKVVKNLDPGYCGCLYRTNGSGCDVGSVIYVAKSMLLEAPTHFLLTYPGNQTRLCALLPSMLGTGFRRLFFFFFFLQRIYSAAFIMWII